MPPRRDPAPGMSTPGAGENTLHGYAVPSIPVEGRRVTISSAPPPWLSARDRCLRALAQVAETTLCARRHPDAGRIAAARAAAAMARRAQWGLVVVAVAHRAIGGAVMEAMVRVDEAVALADGALGWLLGRLAALAGRVESEVTTADELAGSAQPRGPPEGRDREFAPAPAVRLVAASRRETVPWPPEPWQWKEPRPP